jgi:hypothetical protein
MSTKEKEDGGLPRKGFEELEIGDSISDDLLLGWRYVATIPSEVAQYWVASSFSEARITKEGFTPAQSPMKNWGNGVGVVVGSPKALPGVERLILLHKSNDNEFRLFLSRETRLRSEDDVG